jgi:hypothetical protein
MEYKHFKLAAGAFAGVLVLAVAIGLAASYSQHKKKPAPFRMPEPT